ncbi:hypothetical protein DPMN_031872 [Dreissena polymorpha]|uniref:Uncharacterized protein n=1 Tax=Dreissena polymorpha TaxID=45954 RepID=A0A9D4M2P2_DREPO|nr:hypothetical protein DPMN_031872 [Dreissena polymorpha]
MSVGLSVCRSVCRSVGPSTRWLADDNSRMLGPRIMKLHRYIDHDLQMTPIDFEVTRIMKLHGKIDHDSQMTPIDFEVTRSKVKVTMTPMDFEITRIMKLHRYIDRDSQMTPIDFQVTRNISTFGSHVCGHFGFLAKCSMVPRRHPMDFGSRDVGEQ